MREKLSSSYLENQFASLWESYFPRIKLIKEYQFYPSRRYRWDFAAIESKVAIDIQGGIWSKSRMGDNSGSGINKDCEKFCLAASTGWLVFPLTDKMIELQWLEAIAHTIKSRASQTKGTLPKQNTVIQ